MQGFIRILVVICISITTAVHAKHLSEESIDNRTSPVAQVHIEGMEKLQASTLAESATNQAATRNGEAVYNGGCMVCHSIGLANAPKMGDSAAWATLLERGIDDLVKSAKKGKNVMPPMGNCTDCSDEELKSAIHFMSAIK